MFTIEDAKRLCASFRTLEETRPVTRDLLMGYQAMIEPFLRDVAEQLKRGTLRKNRVYSQLIDHPAGFSFGIQEKDEDGAIRLRGKLYTAIYDGDYVGINKAGYAWFWSLASFFNEDERELLKPFLAEVTPNGGGKLTQYVKDDVAPEVVWNFFERVFPKMDWETYGMTSENPILLGSVPMAYDYLRSLVVKRSGVCFHRIGSMTSIDFAKPIDCWRVLIHRPDSEGEPFDEVKLYTYSYHDIPLLNVPPAPAIGEFSINREIRATINPLDVIEVIPEDEDESVDIENDDNWLFDYRGYGEDADKTPRKTLKEIGGMPALIENAKKVLYLFEAWKEDPCDFFFFNEPTFEKVPDEQVRTLLQQFMAFDLEDRYRLIYESYVCPWNYLDREGDLIISIDRISELAASVNLTFKDLMAKADKIARFFAKVKLFPLSGDEVEALSLEELQACYPL